jgi:ArsR family transcriptional regulator
MKKVKLDMPFLEQSTETLRAVAHPLRLAIIEMLYEKKELTVTEIHESLDIEQAVASHHLRIMKDRNVVQVKRSGKSSCYSLVNEDFYKIYEILRNTIQ